MDFADLKTRNPAELKELLNELLGELHNLKIKAAGKQLKQVHKIKDVRRTVAQVQTLLNKK